MKIYKEKITDKEIEIYIDNLVEKINKFVDWDNNPQIKTLSEVYLPEQSQTIINEVIRLSNDFKHRELLKQILYKLHLVPEYIYKIHNTNTLLPIYTAIKDNTNRDSFLLDSFFGNQTSLISSDGIVLFEASENTLLEMVGTNLLKVTLNEEMEEGNAFLIIDFSTTYLNNRAFEFYGEIGFEYIIENRIDDVSTPQKFTGKNQNIILKNLHLGLYSVMKYEVGIDYEFGLENFPEKIQEFTIGKIIQRNLFSWVIVRSV